MRIHFSKPLFAWDCLQDHPSLRTIQDFLRAIPDAKLLESLASTRGRGRNDYPVHTLWGVVLLTIALRHSTIEACLAELRRNPHLRPLIGIQSEDQVPKKWSMSRFLDVLGKPRNLELLREIFNEMAKRLGEVVPDLGRHGAGDATYLNARRKRDEDAEEQETREGLPQAAGGRKEYTDEQGRVTRIVEWFGFKLHLLVDVEHEVSLAYRITSPATGDGEALPEVLGVARANLPAGRIETLAYDKAADTTGVHRTLHEAKIRPVIENRSLWTDHQEEMLPGHDGTSNVVYDEAGTLFCYDKTEEPVVRHRMSYIGHEPARGTLKYRCPARHEGWSCPSDARCNGDLEYGKTVRVKRDIDLRRFPPIPRATKKFERLYKGRTAVERVNARLKVFWGADDGNVTGARRFHAFLGTVMVVHLGLATLLASSQRYGGPMGTMKLGRIQEALRQRMSA